MELGADAGRAGPSRDVGAAAHLVVTSLDVCLRSVPSNPMCDALGVPDAECMRELKAHTGEYSVALRAAGTPPERVVARFKELLGPLVPGPLRDNAIAEAAITWCIQAYYSSPDA